MKKFFAVFIAAFAVILTGYAATASNYRAAAERGDAEAQFNLGVCYKNGWGVTKDLAEAVRWFRKAARQGDQNAQKILNDLGETW